MKNQLLEDIGDAQPALPPRSRSSAPPPTRPAPGSAARPQVWRGRRPPVEQPARPPLPPAPPPDLTVPSSEPPPDLFSFASQQPDLSIQLPDEPVPWMERWGRKAFGWTLAAVAVAGLAGAGLWLYGETQVESTLALVADQTPPAAPAPPPAMP
ncbi:hypothetical protein KBW98_04160, partial [Massilia sp. ST3]|nr:hypothetical protein [Massilia sp. ST3]